MKLCFFDVETTGRDAEACAIIQFAALLEVNGERKAELNLTMRPFPGAVVEPEALACHGIQPAEFEAYPTPMEAHDQLVAVMSSLVNRYDKTDFFVPVAFNGGFDISFVSKWFARCGDKYLGSYLKRQALLDPMAIHRFYAHMNLIEGVEGAASGDTKLGTLCEFYGISLEGAHDALADTKALRALYYELVKRWRAR